MPRQLRLRHPTTGRAFRPELGRFGVLPRELRDQIYSYLYGGWRIHSRLSDGSDPYMITNPYRISSSTGIRSTFVNDDGDSTRPYPNAIVDSLLVSRRFSEEVAHILYATNCFHFRGPGLLELFLDQIAEGYRQQITKVYLKCGRLSCLGTSRAWWRDTMQALVRLPGIKYLTISSIVVAYRPYEELGGVSDRVVEVRESKLFHKLEHAKIQCCYDGVEDLQVMELYLEGMQRFLVGDPKPSAG